jgi:hypothetical protein
MEEGKVEFKPHAFLQLQGGVAHTLGEADFMDLMSPAAALNLGYKFTPVFGMRLGASGWQGKGGWVAPAQVYSFQFVQANLDLMLDLRSMFSGFNPDRVFNPYLFAGGAYAYGFENDEANALNTGTYDLEYLWQDNKGFPGGRVGLGLDFKLSNAVSFMIEETLIFFLIISTLRKLIILTGSLMLWLALKLILENHILVLSLFIMILLLLLLHQLLLLLLHQLQLPHQLQLLL